MSGLRSNKWSQNISAFNLWFINIILINCKHYICLAWKTLWRWWRLKRAEVWRLKNHLKLICWSGIDTNIKTFIRLTLYTYNCTDFVYKQFPCYCYAMDCFLYYLSTLAHMSLHSMNSNRLYIDIMICTVLALENSLPATKTMCVGRDYREGSHTLNILYKTRS